MLGQGEEEPRVQETQAEKLGNSSRYSQASGPSFLVRSRKYIEEQIYDRKHMMVMLRHTMFANKSAPRVPPSSLVEVR
jgi:hypothetical protein